MNEEEKGRARSMSARFSDFVSTSLARARSNTFSGWLGQSDKSSSNSGATGSSASTTQTIGPTSPQSRHTSRATSVVPPQTFSKHELLLQLVGEVHDPNSYPFLCGAGWLRRNFDPPRPETTATQMVSAFYAKYDPIRTVNGDDIVHIVLTGVPNHFILEQLYHRYGLLMPDNSGSSPSPVSSPFCKEKRLSPPTPAQRAEWIEAIKPLLPPERVAWNSSNAAVMGGRTSPSLEKYGNTKAQWFVYGGLPAILDRTRPTPVVLTTSTRDFRFPEESDVAADLLRESHDSVLKDVLLAELLQFSDTCKEEDDEVVRNSLSTSVQSRSLCSPVDF